MHALHICFITIIIINFITYLQVLFSFSCAYRAGTFSAHFLCLNLILIVCAAAGESRKWNP